MYRDGIVLFEGELDTLKRFKDDAKEVAQGYECGITIENITTLKKATLSKHLKWLKSKDNELEYSNLLAIKHK